MADNEMFTFEKVWATLQENAEQLKETRRIMQETFQDIRQANKEIAEMQRENVERMKETDRQFKETDRQFKETDRQFKETDRQFKETDRKIEKLSGRLGDLIEHLVAPGILEKFRALNFAVKKISQNVKIKNDEKQTLAEVDILLENGDTVISVEVKAKPDEGDVDDHIHRMEVLRKVADANAPPDTRKFQGAIAGAIMSDGVRNYAHKKGFYVIEQTGDTVMINIPDGFKPREW